MTLYKNPLRNQKKCARMAALESIDIGSTIRLEADAPLSGIKSVNPANLGGVKAEPVMQALHMGWLS